MRFCPDGQMTKTDGPAQLRAMFSRTGSRPSDLDIDRYLKLLLSEKKLSPEPSRRFRRLRKRSSRGNPLDRVRLDSLKVGDGVNALKPGAQIDFAPGVTVIFGENGSGKSGFVRVLKRAAGLRTAEDILHNVRADKRPTPARSFTVTVGAQARRFSGKTNSASHRSIA